MINKDTLIENLKDFKDSDKYSSKQLSEFLYKNPVTSDFFKYHVKQFKSYIKSSPRTIVKYSKEYHEYLHLSYTSEEISIIKEIREKHLVTFWILDLVKNGLTLLNCGGAKLRFAIDVHEGNKGIADLIDYIIKFCIIPYSESTSDEVKLTYTERIVLEYIHQGFLVPKIAEEMNCSKHTIENHKKNICKKIDALDKEEYKGKTASTKLRILTSKIFK